MIETLKDQELVLDCEAMITSHHRMNDGGDNMMGLRIQGEDSKALAKMMSREGRNVIVHIVMAQYSDGGGIVNQTLIDQTEIPATPNPAPKALKKPVEPKGEFGQLAKALRLHTFFRTPTVWKQIGSDEHYQAFCRRQNCAYTKQAGNENDRIQAAHVRRIQDGAGTSIKPPYATIPLLASVHRKQHNNGESAIGGRDWCDKARMYYVFKWGWETLKERLGYQSWATIPPLVLCEWAIDHDVYDYLPLAYKKCVETSGQGETAA